MKSRKTDKISAEHIIRIAKAFNVSTDFLLGVVNVPDRKNYDVEELGLSVQAARDANRQRVPVYQADLTTIQNAFMAALKEVKRELGNDLTAAQTLTKEVTQQMYASLTKGGDIQKAQMTPELFASAVTQSVAGMDGAQPEALEKLGKALTEFAQTTMDYAKEKQQNAGQ